MLSICLKTFSVELAQNVISLTKPLAGFASYWITFVAALWHNGICLAWLKAQPSDLRRIKTVHPTFAADALSQVVKVADMLHDDARSSS